MSCNQQVAQQVAQQYFGDLNYNHNPSVTIQNGEQVIQNCSALCVLLQKAKELSDQINNYDPNNELWNKMLLFVPFSWVQGNAKQFLRELERYKEQLDSAVIDKIHPNDVNWMKAYVKAMIDILTPYNK